MTWGEAKRQEDEVKVMYIPRRVHSITLTQKEVNECGECRYNKWCNKDMLKACKSGIRM